MKCLDQDQMTKNILKSGYAPRLTPECVPSILCYNYKNSQGPYGVVLEIINGKVGKKCYRTGVY